MQKHCAGPFPEPRAHSTPAGAGRKPAKLTVLGARRRERHPSKQAIPVWPALIEVNTECCGTTKGGKNKDKSKEM